VEILVFSSSLLVFMLVVVIFGRIGKNIDRKNRRLNALLENADANIDEDLEVPFFQRFLVPAFSNLIKVFSRFVPKIKGVEVSKLEKDLKMAGILMPPREFVAARLIFIISFIMLMLIVAVFGKFEIAIKLVIIAFGFIASILLPKYLLQLLINTRQEGIRLQMPDVMDLLSVSVESGMGFDSALIKIEEHSKGPLVDELMMVHREISMGRTRREAFKNFAERTNVPEVRIFTGAIIQAEHLGLPIKNVLKSQAQQLRISRKQNAEKRAMIAPIKMMIPLLIFIFPVIFIILLGPTVIQMMQTFGK